jgi:hypothetical protein
MILTMLVAVSTSALSLNNGKPPARCTGGCRSTTTCAWELLQHDHFLAYDERLAPACGTGFQTVDVDAAGNLDA